TGADWAMPLGGFTMRAEAAWLDDRPYLRRSSDLIAQPALARLPLKQITLQLLKRHRAAVQLGALFPSFDTVEWGAGADYLWHGYQPLLQVNQIAFLERTPPLVVNDPETRLVASLHKRYLGERMEAEVRGVWAVERQAWFVVPRLSYRVRGVGAAGRLRRGLARARPRRVTRQGCPVPSAGTAAGAGRDASSATTMLTP